MGHIGDREGCRWGVKVKGPCTLSDTNDIVATLSDYVPLDLSSDANNALLNTNNMVLTQ